MAGASDAVLSLTAQIVSAHVSNNSFDTVMLPDLITNIHRALIDAGQARQASPSSASAVPVTKSVFANRVVCLHCGKSFSMLKRHLKTDHQMTPDDYRLNWNLPATYPLVAPDYAKQRSSLAKEIGLGRRPKNAGVGRKTSQ